MNELLQYRKYPSGQHPDADQLSAFVEQALPEHERMETLAHLSECTDCRQIVSLSLPPLEDAAVESRTVMLPRSSGRFAGLFSSWNVAWIAVPALAALVILSIHLRNLPVSQRQTASGQVADAHPPAQPTPPVAAKPDASNVLLKPKAAPERKTAVKAKPAPAAAPSEIESSAINGRDVASLKVPPPLIVQKRGVQDGAASLSSSQPSQSGNSSAFMKGSMSGMAQGGVAAAPPPRPSGTALGFLRQAPGPVTAPAVSQRVATQQATTQLGSVASQTVPTQPAPPVVLNQASVSASGAALAVPSVAADSAVVEVNAQTNQIATSGREISKLPAGLASAKSTYVSGPAPLPSGLGVLSLASNLRQRIAIDTQNQLFLSDDAGQHWRAIKPHWKGRAVMVATASPGLSRARGVALAAPERFSAGIIASASPGNDVGSLSLGLSGTVKDAAGAVIPGATVVATDSRTALVRTVQTDASGRYVVGELPPGVYRIEVNASGFLKQSQTVALETSQQAMADIVLPVGASTQTVTVEVSSAQVETSDRVMPEAGLKAKKAPVAAAQPPSGIKILQRFMVTTDTGERWTSADGETWKRE